jgi:cytochrome c peroxidase
MKKILLVVLLSGAIQTVLGDVGSASQVEIESAWLAFIDARGEASLIRGDVEHPSANEIFRVIPDVSADSLDEEKLQLGFDLFREGRLSRDGTVACTTCHIGMMGGVDRHPVSFGIGGAKGTLNAPTIFNAALNFRQFWDGRALTLQEQALGPIQNLAEFGHDLDGAVAVLKSIPDYVSAFDKLYADGISAANLGDAIAYYETMNFTGLGSPFLRQFEEEPTPLSSQALRGQQRFVEVGCASCHNGVNLGGNSYQRLGVAEPWYGNDRLATEADDGLFARTGREQDRHVFKVPTLHNVAITGPWLHDGSVTSLQQAVDRMARHQSGRYLENNDIDDIVAFLRSLGDSLGLVGDCTASGSYGVNMNCSVKRVSANQDGGAVAPVISEVDLPDPAILVQRHQEEYSEALDLAAAATTRIADEMQRIRSGQVVHFDFLQYEHIEMLRHARALSFPPANLEADQRQALLSQATELQQSAEQYELIIGDFLRSHAAASSAKANIQDLLRILSVEADEKTLVLLAQAEQSALAYYAQPTPDTQQGVESSSGNLNGISLDPQRLEELQLQVRLLLENASISQM